jgi:hypothetical protein
MLMSLLSLALAADAPVALVDDQSGLVAVDAEGSALSVPEFAEAMGDAPTLEAYRRHIWTARASGLIGWTGGSVVMAGGAGAALFGQVADQDEVRLGGLTFFAIGAAAFAVGTTGFVAGKVHFNRMETWYTLPEAEALLAEYQRPPELGPGVEPELRVLWTDRGLQSDRGGDVLTAEGFAYQVGDLETYRRARSFKWVNTAAGVTLLAGGYVATMTGVSDNDPAIAGLGLLTSGAGLLVLTMGRRVYTDMDVWYTRHEAESWLEAGP